MREGQSGSWRLGSRGRDELGVPAFTPKLVEQAFFGWIVETTEDEFKHSFSPGFKTFVESSVVDPLENFFGNGNCEARFFRRHELSPRLHHKRLVMLYAT